ncbi:GNAT family N-acetyltransferase [Halosegnis longus]|uniref:GNAT family N-acetyltransferase n=1 Tax=Halosegnis longus TaxID=2216012 RepID=UPI00096A75BC|nr:GNAT family N-acetyltransferase [Salella cibi]
MHLHRLPDGTDDLFWRYVQYAFQPDAGPELEESDRPDPPHTRYGLYPDTSVTADDEPVTICSSYDFSMWARDSRVSAGGLSTVATPPEHRRNGYVEVMLRKLCRRYRETDTPVSVLWPFKHAFYAQFGWATASRRLKWETEPSTLRSAAATGGTWERVGRDAWESLDAIHEAATGTDDLSLDRSEAWWRTRQLRSFDTDPYVYRWRDADGDARAWLAYTIDGDWGDRTLYVRSYDAADTEAFRHLLGFLTDHDSQVGEVQLETATDSPLHAMVDDPDDLSPKLTTGPMIRFVDVPVALEALSYPDGVDATVEVGIRDPLLDSVAGRYRLAVADGAATVERRGDDPTGDAVASIGAFSQLAVGYRGASDLAATDDLDADSEAVETLAAVFPATTTYLREGF